MKTAAYSFFLLSLSFLSLSSVVPAPRPGILPPAKDDKDGGSCFVLQIADISLDYRFQLVLKTPAEIDSTPDTQLDRVGSPLKFIRDPNPVPPNGAGQYVPVTSGQNTQVLPLTLKGGILGLVVPNFRPEAYLVAGRLRQQVKFRPDPSTSASFYAGYACKGSSTWKELRSDVPNSVFCIFDGKLWIKERSRDSRCREVVAVIKKTR